MTRTIRTAAELDALPVGSVVRGTAFEYGPAATIYVRQEEFWYAGWGVDEEAYFDLPVVVLHDPSAPAPAPSVVPDAAVEAAASAVRKERAFSAAAAFGVPMDGVPQCAEMIARAALTAALPLLTAAPSATRDEVPEAVLADFIAEQFDVEGPTALARRLRSRFNITQKEDR